MCPWTANISQRHYQFDIIFSAPVSSTSSSHSSGMSVTDVITLPEALSQVSETATFLLRKVRNEENAELSVDKSAVAEAKPKHNWSSADADNDEEISDLIGAVANTKSVFFSAADASVLPMEMVATVKQSRIGRERFLKAEFSMCARSKQVEYLQV